MRLLVSFIPPTPFNQFEASFRVNSGGQFSFNQTGPYSGWPLASAYTPSDLSALPEMIEEVEGMLALDRLISYKNSRHFDFDMDEPFELTHAFLNPVGIEQFAFAESKHPGRNYIGHELVHYGEQLSRTSFDSYEDTLRFFTYLRVDFDATKMRKIDKFMMVPLTLSKPPFSNLCIILNQHFTLDIVPIALINSNSFICLRISRLKKTL